MIVFIFTLLHIFFFQRLWLEKYGLIEKVCHYDQFVRDDPFYWKELFDFKDPFNKSYWNYKIILPLRRAQVCIENFNRKKKIYPINEKPRDRNTFIHFEHPFEWKEWDPEFLKKPSPSVGYDTSYIYPLRGSDIVFDLKDFPDFIPLQNMGIQAYLGTISYTSGYIILPAIGYPVDTETINLYQQNHLSGFWYPTGKNAHIKYHWEFINAIIRNGGKEYHYFIWDDKDRVYYFASSNIKRVKKEKDFHLLYTSER